MLNIKERNANTVQPPEADTVILFLDAADSKLKLKDSSGDISEVSTNVIGIPDGGATGEVLAKASGDGGDVEWIDTTGGVKEYVALLTQTGTNAPVATVIKNTLGGTVVWTYDNVGRYTGTLASAFTENKTFCISHVANQETADITTSFGRVTTNTVGLQVLVPAFGFSDVFSDLQVKIEVYP